MIPEYPPNPRAELEAKVTALLLGELSAEEAAKVRDLIAHDAELAKLRDRLGLTLDLLRETTATPVGATPAQPTPLKLSAERREKLLASFKTVRPKEFAEPRRRKITLLEVAAVAAIIMILAALILPANSSAKRSAQKRRMFEEMKFAESTSSSASAPALRIPEVKTAQTVAHSTRQIILPQTEQQHAGEDASLAKNNGVNRWTVNGAIQTHGEALESLQVADQLQQSDHSSLRALNDNNGSGAGATAPPTVTASPSASFAFQATNATLAYVETPAPESATVNGNLDDKKMEQRVVVTDGGRAQSGLEFKDRLRTFGVNNYNQPSSQPAPASPPTQASDSESVRTAAHGGMAMMGDRESAGFHLGLGGTQSMQSVTPTAGFQQSIDLHGRSAFAEPSFVDAGKTSNSGTVVAKSAVRADSNANYLFAFGNGKSTNDVIVQFQTSSERRVNSAPAGAANSIENDAPLARPMIPAPTPQPEVLTSVNAFTTFSLNVSDVAFKLAQASLQNGVMPDAASMRSEEFINAFDYRDPEPTPGAPIGFAWERAGDPFARNRDFLRFSIKAAAQGREAGRPLNLVLLLDKSGSMERADRVEIIAEALKVLASELKLNDTLSVVVFARTAHLFVDGVSGKEAAEIAKKLRDMTPEGGTNLEEAMKLAYATAMRHYLANGENRVVLMTDGAANLGNVDPDVLKKNVESNRKQGIALDCFGIGWNGYNDNMLETLSRAGNGRYGFLQTPEEAATEFAGKLAGALRVAAADVKVQVEFNPKRVTAYRQIGYAKDQLKKEDFRDNNVKAAQIGAAESGNALYTVEINPAGEGDVCTVHVRFRVPGTQDYQGHEWEVPYTGSAVPLDKASPAMRLCASAASFCEWLAGSPYAVDVTPEKLLGYLNGVPQVYGADERPAKLQMMILQARRISGK